MKNPKIINVIVYALILALAFGAIWMIFGNNTDRLTYSQVMELLEKKQVSFIHLQDLLNYYVD